MILVEQGRIQYKIFKQTFRAKSCLKEAMDIGQILPGNQFTKDWYKDAVQMTAELRAALDELVKKTDPKKDKVKEEHKEELNEIIEHNNVDQLEDFVDFIFSKYPPKHLEPVPTKPSVSSNSATHKKLLLRLTAYYHTDKVNREKFGDKYFVFCEEISMALNQRYNNMKF